MLTHVCSRLSAVRPSTHPPTRHTQKRDSSFPMLLYTVSFYICFSLSSLSVMPFCSAFTWTEKRQRFFSWETLGEVCCSVSREWGWNPVFLGLVSLPVLRSHHGLCVTIGIVSGLAAVLGNSRLFSLSRILGFWLYTAPALYFNLPLFLSCSFLTSLCVFSHLSFIDKSFFTLISFPTAEFHSYVSMQGTHLHKKVKLPDLPLMKDRSHT